MTGVGVDFAFDAVGRGSIVADGLRATRNGGTTVAVRFYINSTNYYSGSAFVQASITAAENGLVTVSYTFTGNGALTYT